MSGFECKVSDLNASGDKVSSFETSVSKATNPIADSNPVTSTIASVNKTTGNVSAFTKILNEKNLKTILLIAFVYFLLHSEPVLEFVNAKIPSIISNLTLNSLGKLIFGLLIGILFIVGSFFFQDP